MKAAPSAEMGDITKRSIRGGLVTVGARMVIVFINLASTVVLARLLTPDDFGVLAMVLSVTAFVGVFRDFGLSTASVQRGAQLGPVEASNLFWLNVLVGLALTAIVAAAAPAVGWLFAAPQAVPVTLALSLSFALAGLGNQHAATLQRLMLFHRRALADIVGAALTLAVTVVLAFRGGAYWSLVWGALAGTAATSLLTVALSPLRVQRPRRDPHTRDLLRFGGHVTAFELVNYFHRNLDNVLIGRFWGAEALGLYSRAYQLLMFPITNLRAPINAVAFSAMVHLKDRPQDFRAYYCKVSFLLAMVSMPLVAFLAVAAEEVIALLLGSRWMEVVPIFQVLAATAFIQPVASLRGLVALSAGRSGDYLKLGFINAVAVCTAFAVGLPWGPLGVATGYGIAVYALLWPTLRLTFRGTGICMQDFGRSVAQSAAASVGAGGAVLLASGLLHPFQHLAVVVLCFKLLVFFLTWLLFNLLWPQGFFRLRSGFAALRQMRRR